MRETWRRDAGESTPNRSPKECRTSRLRSSREDGTGLRWQQLAPDSIGWRSRSLGANREARRHSGLRNKDAELTSASANALRSQTREKCRIPGGDSSSRTYHSRLCTVSSAPESSQRSENGGQPPSPSLYRCCADRKLRPCLANLYLITS